MAKPTLKRTLTPSKKNISQILSTVGQGREREYILINHSVQYRTGSNPLFISFGLVGGSLDYNRDNE